MLSTVSCFVYRSSLISGQVFCQIICFIYFSKTYSDCKNFYLLITRSDAEPSLIIKHRLKELVGLYTCTVLSLLLNLWIANNFSSLKIDRKLLIFWYFYQADFCDISNFNFSSKLQRKLIPDFIYTKHHKNINKIGY